MFSTSQDLAPNSIQIKQDDKFFSRLLSKESCMTNPSFRVYYGGGASAAVPFMWESQPGTPKCSFNETTLPPLTPPPSYYSNANKNPIKKNSRSNSLLHILFPKMNMLKKSDHRDHVSSSSLSSNSSWSSSNLEMVVPIRSPKKNHHCVQSLFSSRGSSFSFDFRADYEEAEAINGSPTSTLWVSRIKGCYGW